MIINTLFSPNFNKLKREIKSIKFIVIHYTGMQSERESLKRLTSSKSKVSCHLLINQKGKAYRLVNDENMSKVPALLGKDKECFSAKLDTKGVMWEKEK